MKQAKELDQQLNVAIEFVKEKLDAVFGNSTFTMILKVLVVLYAAFCVQKLPLEYSKLVENIFVRFAVLALIVFVTVIDPVLGLLLAVAFVLTIQASNRNKLNSIVQADANHEEDNQPVEKSDENDTFVDGNGDDENPADKTLTDNLNSSAVADSCQQDFFTTNNDLEDAQNDTVADSNQMDQVQTFENQMGPQGMNPPYGFDFKDADTHAQF